MTRLLLIDDDQRLGELLERYFQRFDMVLDSALRPSEGFSRLAATDYDLVILDVMLPEMDGFEACRTIRKTSDIPIVMLTARGEVMDRVVGLEIGADDYLAKPFEPRELVARIQNILKRVSRKPVQAEKLCFDQLVIDIELRQVLLDGKEVNLTGTEFDLLQLMAQHPNKVYSRDDILNELKGVDADLYSRSVDIMVSRLRQKLKPGNYIKTIRGSGYCFVGKVS
jgi:two-component system OmpR family response regulator